LANTENLVANGSFESDLSSWVATGSAVASINTSDSLAGGRSVLVTSNGTVSGGVYVDYQFEDANGTQSNVAINNGVSAASWNFPTGQTQNGNLNYGYSQYYKWTQVDQGAGTLAYRTLAFADALGTETTSDMTQYSFTVDFAKWDLRQNWDANNASAGDKGIQITLDSTSASGDNQAIIGLKTQGTNGFHAYSQGQGSSFAQAGGSTFDTDGAGAVTGLVRYEAAGALMQINGDLSSGTWSAQAKTGEDGADWVALGSGTGLTSIDSIILSAKTPAIGSWGGGDVADVYNGDATAGGTTGDYMSIDSITLSAVPEPSSYALIAGMLALASIMVRRRK
jgi:hypothetical protein